MTNNILIAKPKCYNIPDDNICSDIKPVQCADSVCNPSDPASGIDTGCIFTPNHDKCDDASSCSDQECNIENGCTYTYHHDKCDDGNACSER